MKNKEYFKESDHSKEKKELLALLLEEEGLNLDKPRIITPRKGGEVAPLSFAQQRLWFLNQMGTGSAYNIPLAIRLKGLPNIKALEKSLNEIIRRHEALRTTFRSTGGRPVQVIAENISLEMPLIDLSGQPKAEREVEAKRLRRDEATRRFDLAKGPLLSAALIRLSEEEHILLLTMHHIVSDGWSMGVFTTELAALYKAYCNGEASPLPELPIQYADFAHWQREWLQGEVLENQLSYWRKQLEGVPVLQLLTDHPRPAVQTYRGVYQSLLLSATLTEALNALSQAEGATLFMTLLAAFNTLLYRYTGQKDIVVGSPIANRNREEIEGLIGFFVNSLVMRTDLSGNPTFRGLIRRVKKVAVGAYEHQDLPFEKLVEELRPERDMSHTPLFQVMFNMINVRDIAVELHNLSAERVSSLEFESKFDMTLHVLEGEGGLAVGFEYNTDLFDAERIDRMVGYFQTLLEGIVADPEKCICDLPILDEAERRQLLVEWNDTSVEYPRDKCIHELFEKQVKRTPDAAAVIFGKERLTYRELNTRANQLAHYLRLQGVVAESRVGIWMDRSLEMVVALLGTLKAGGAYVPLDPSYPQKRLAFMLEDAQAPVLLTREKFLEDLPAYAGHVVCLDKDFEAIAGASEKNPISGIAADSAAYVIYTSGSTGTPKGVIGLHRGTVNRLSWMWRVYPFIDGEVCCQKTYLSFVDSVWEIFGPLLKGVPAVIIPEEVVKDPHLLVDNLATAHVSRILLVPSLLRVLLDSFGDLQKRLLDLKIWITSGEEISVELAQRFGQVMPEARLINLYGSSEVSADVSCYEVADGRQHRCIPIGRPIDNTSIYILDSDLQPVPIGVPGELYIGGIGLARGYLNQPDLTAERFIPSPFGPEEVLFKTGDLGRYLADGNIEYLGRIDHQVKARGFRIELGEIESQVKGLEAVSNCVVVLREDRPGDQRLAAYYVCKDGQAVSESELRRQLQAKLPGYMLPQYFVELSSIPLTPSGKVDRKALPKPQASGTSEQGYVAPRTEAEQLVAGIWSNVLGLEHIGVHDSFFELGGHSLLVIRIISRLREVFEVELAVQALFEAPTVAGLTERIEATHRKDEGLQTSPLQTVCRDQDLPLSFAQERLWFLHHLEPDSVAYSMPRSIRFKGVLRKDALERTYVELARRHETLRTTFDSTDGNPVLRIAAEPNILFDTIDLRHLPEVEREAEAKRLSEEDARTPFDLRRGPLFRIRLFQLDNEDHVLHSNMHHIISDGWSFGVMTREIAALYSAFIKDEPADLPGLPVQYADYAFWQRQWLQGEALEAQLNYWKDKLGGELPVLELPTDRPRPAVQTHRGAIESLALPKELTDALQVMSRLEGVTLFMTLLAAFKILLYRLTGQEEIIVGTPIAGRNRTELEGLIGFFMNTIVIRTDLSGQPSFRELLRRIRETALGAYAHQDMPFERLVEELSPERDLSRTPLFQVFFNHIVAMGDKAGELPGLEAEDVGGLDPESKFDMTLYVLEGEGGIGLRSLYNTDLFDRWRMAEVLKQYEELLKQIVENSDEKISHYSLVTAEAQQVLPDPSTPLSEPLQTSIIEMFAKWVKRIPEQPALSKGDQALTYEMLFKRTQMLARILRSNGLNQGDVVAVHGPRSFGLIVNMMAVLSSGGVLLPIDSSLPHRRQQLILQEAGAKFLLYVRGRGFEDAWWEQDSALGIQSLEVDTEGLVRADTDFDLDAVSLPEPGSGDAAYIFFTSGTTGVPKGVLGSHKGLNHFLNWQREAFDITPEDRVAHLTSVSFDPVLREIFLPLTSGATLCLQEDIDILSANDVLSWIDREWISVLHTVPSLAQSWLTNKTIEVSLNAMRWVFFAGESLTQNLVDRWQSSFPSAEIVNLYGPAETTLAKCFYQLSSGVQHGVQPLGRPLPQTQALVLSRDNQLCSIGEPGEIVLRTPFRSLGYINNHEENRKRFVKNPFRDDEKDQLYYTGDSGRYRPNGMLEFLGRLDDQVKIRGVRVEPNEVTVTLAKHPQVDSCFVTNNSDEQRQTRLVAYVVITEQNKTTVSELRAYLRKQLPVTMVPEAFVFLDALPLTTRGKVDRRALPVPDERRPDIEASFAVPRNAAEEALAEIWGEILRVEKVGIHDNFFELGGHSLLATRVVSRIQQEFEVDLKLMHFFKMPTIAELAKGIEGLLWINSGIPSEDEAELQDREKWVV